MAKSAGNWSNCRGFLLFRACLHRSRFTLFPARAPTSSCSKNAALKADLRTAQLSRFCPQMLQETVLYFVRPGRCLQKWGKNRPMNYDRRGGNGDSSLLLSFFKTGRPITTTENSALMQQATKKRYHRGHTIITKIFRNQIMYALLKRTGNKMRAKCKIT